jgi:hypothetical protein
MEGLAPALSCILEIQSSLLNGESIRSGLMKYLRQPNSDFHPALRQFLFAWDQNKDWKKTAQALQSPYRRALLEVIASGLSGQSIQTQLRELQTEIERACDLEIKSFIEMLPLKMLIPLLFFQFPAFLLLLFGPLLSRFMTELSR